MSASTKAVGEAIRAEFLRQKIAPWGVTSVGGNVPPIDWSAVGRAAIIAIREPSQAMLIEGTNSLNVGAAFVQTAFRAMIDEMLAE